VAKHTYGVLAMDAAEFRDLVKACGWTPRWVALMAGAPPQRGADWSGGVRPVPPEVEAWLRRVSEVLRAEAPPALRRRSGGRPVGSSYVLEMLRWAGRPMTVREMCDLAPQFGRDPRPLVLRELLDRQVAGGRAVRSSGRPITYSLPDAK